MLTLIEPPVAKRGRSVVSNRSAQHLLQFSAAVEDDDFDENESDPSDIQRSGRRTLLQMLDSLLVGTSSSAEYSLQWKREFSQRPSWCDADMALQQIKRGKAQGNKIALYSRSLIQKSLFHLGSFVQQHAVLVILTVLVLFSFCCYGLQYVRIETDIVKLWVARK
ncbi:hypothetical protein AB6A40_009840 [Gnathostoma spinigerum]|uniref:Uncharacterized protein n=1 Tax=Gnathostoma spinigerum TaxID=75299 RepID=A0ABD6EUW6_9BILA